ncbi:MAG: hypothetical protein AB8C46_22865 [Burkholderiaceae bacterium]
MPESAQRKVIGSWDMGNSIGTPCTRSFERVKKAIYQVIRCADGSGGKRGKKLRVRGKNIFYKPESASGDHYVILDNGDLSVRDRDGEIQTERESLTVWPDVENNPNWTAIDDLRKTAGLSCFVIGYRYGFAATLAMKGSKVDSEWDFAIPKRCNPDLGPTKLGIKKGVREATARIKQGTTGQ